MNTPEENIDAIAQALADYLERRKNPPRMNTYGYSFMEPMGQSIVDHERRDVDGGPRMTKGQT